MHPARWRWIVSPFLAVVRHAHVKMLVRNEVAETEGVLIIGVIRALHLLIEPSGVSEELLHVEECLLVAGRSDAI